MRANRISNFSAAIEVKNSPWFVVVVPDDDLSRRTEAGLATLSP